MINASEGILKQTRVSSQIQALLLGLGAILLILFGMPQMITGVIVNMILIICTEKCGVERAIMLGLITPIVASFSAVLPIALLVMVPFIVISNAIYVSVYNALMQKGRFIAVCAGAFLKAVFLYMMVSITMARPVTLLVGGRLQAVDIPQAVAVMMTWPQLLTALAGGFLAIGILSLADKRRR